MSPPIRPERLLTPEVRDSIIEEGRRNGVPVEQVRAALEAAGFRRAGAPPDPAPPPAAPVPMQAAESTAAVRAGAPQTRVASLGETLASGVMGAAKSATFGFDDEIGGVVGALTDRSSGLPFSERYDAAKAAYNARRAGEQAVAPGAAMVGRGAGLFVNPIKGGTAAAAAVGERALGGLARAMGARAGGRVASGANFVGGLAGDGAAQGALQGAGEADDVSLGGRLLKGLVGGVESAVAAPVLGVTARGVGAGVRTALPAIGAGEGRAARLLGTALRRDQVPVAELPGRVRGVPVGPMAPEFAGRAVTDVGENVASLANLVAKSPGPGRETLTTAARRRQQQSGTVATNALTNITGTERSARENVDAIIKLRGAEAQPLWQRVYESGAEIPRSALGYAAEAPEAPAAWSEARRLIARQFQVPLSDIPAEIPEVLGPREAHFFKQGLEALIERAPMAPLDRGGAAAVGQAQQQRILGDLTERLRTALPGFSEANDAFAGASALARAAQEGASILQKSAGTAEQIAARLAEMTPAEQQLFREGAVSALRDRMAKTRYGASKDLPFRSDDAQAVLDAIVPDPVARGRIDVLLGNLADQGQTDARLLGGSPTAPLLLEAEDAGGQLAAEAGMAAATGNLPGLIAKLGGGLTRRVQGIDDATGEALARMVAAQGDDVTAVADLVAQALARQAKQGARLRGGAARASTLTQ